MTNPEDQLLKLPDIKGPLDAFIEAVKDKIDRDRGYELIQVLTKIAENWDLDTLTVLSAFVATTLAICEYHTVEPPAEPGSMAS
jgi:predicted oxidoreductase